MTRRRERKKGLTEVDFELSSLLLEVHHFLGSNAGTETGVGFEELGAFFELGYLAIESLLGIADFLELVL
jgi:hypothetical protein